MTHCKTALLGTAAALALSLGALGAPALAQDGAAGQQAETSQPARKVETGTPAEDTTAEAGADDEEAMQEQAAGAGPDAAADDALIVTVGEDEIRESDVMAALEMLPPQARQQPPRVLVPAVVNQLIMRELVLDAAVEAGLEEDPEVVAITGGGGQDALEQALVRVWFERELAGRVTEEEIEAAYDDLKAANPDLDQSLAEVRPQIQNQLQRQAAAAVGTELREDAEIVFYDETGNPVEADAQQ